MNVYSITIEYRTRSGNDCVYFGVERAPTDWEAIAKAERKLTRRRDIKFLGERRCEVSGWNRAAIAKAEGKQS